MTIAEVKEKLKSKEVTVAVKEDMVCLVDDAETQNIVRLRYIDGLRWNAVVSKTFFSMKTVHRRADKAIQEIATKISKVEGAR